MTIRGTIKPKKQLPPHIIDGTEEDYCYVCGKLRWVCFSLTLHEEGIKHPFCAQLPNEKRSLKSGDRSLREPLRAVRWRPERSRRLL